MQVPYIVTSLRLPKTDILRRQSYNITSVIDDTSTCTSRAYIDAYVVVGGDCDLVSM